MVLNQRDFSSIWLKLLIDQQFIDLHIIVFNLADTKKLQPRPYRKKDYGRSYDGQYITRQPRAEFQSQTRNYKRGTSTCKRSSEKSVDGIQVKFKRNCMLSIGY